MHLPGRLNGIGACLAYGLAAALAGLACAAGVVSAAQAANARPGAETASLTPVVGWAAQHDVSAPLAALPAQAASAQAAGPAEESLGGRLMPNRIADPLRLAQLAAEGDAVNDPVVQRGPLSGAAAMPDAVHSFDGVANVNNPSLVLPPDPNGDIGYDPATGQRYYMQWVNKSFAIWQVDASGAFTQVVTPTAGNLLWSGFGGVCQTRNDGDPIVLFDPIARRWLASQFAVPSNGPFSQCVAMSTSGDPTGAWYRYRFEISATKFNDYAKFGVWPDGYYMSINQFLGATGPWAGAAAVVFERDKMLLGQAARFVYFDLADVSLAFGGQLPSDLDGTILPPAGAPNYFVEADDNTAGLGADALRLWKFHVDWTNPANSTFGLNGQPNHVLPVASFSLLPCVLSGNRACVPQPGAAPKLDALGDRLMHRLAYRNFGDHEALVMNHTVNVNPSASQAGVRWYEVRDPDGSPTIFQQGTYAPDGLDRWMGSIAMDGLGNIALGYSVSSSSLFPSIRYTGRLAGDPLGQLTFAEASLMAGGGAQTDSRSRWGDYSMLGVDPLDNCTFWYTNEYYPSTGTVGWRTRISSFAFPSCLTAPVGHLTGVISDAVSLRPLSGALVTANGSQGLSAQSDRAGRYDLLLLQGPYTLTVSAQAHYTQLLTNVQVTSGSVTAQGVLLVPWPYKLYLPAIYR